MTPGEVKEVANLTALSEQLNALSVDVRKTLEEVLGVPLPPDKAAGQGVQTNPLDRISTTIESAMENLCRSQSIIRDELANRL